MRIRRLFVAVFIIMLVYLTGMKPARTESYTYTSDGNTRRSAAIYEASRAITGKMIGAGDFSLPEDMYWYEDKLYIADTGNDRIVILDESLNFVREIETLYIDGEEDYLYTPTGCFVNERGLLICDKNNKRLLLLNDADEAVLVYKAPDVKALSGITFKPEKAVMDKDGNAYVLANGVYQGLLLFDFNGTFQGFFGANVIESSFGLAVQRFWKMFFSKETSENMARSVPIEYSNIVIDQDDFIYTSIYKTESGSGNAKKLNALGNNILTHPNEGNGLDLNRYGDLKNYTYKGQSYTTHLTDISVDEDGILTVLDSTWGRLFQYGPDGDLLGTFGGTGNVLGTFLNPSALVRMGEKYAVLDKAKGTITVFSPTQYRQLLGKALKYYNAGEYQASIDIWLEVLKYDASMSLAYKSIGKAYIQQEKWEEALEYLKIAEDRTDYSIAFGNLRREFIRENFVWLLAVTIAMCVLIRVLYRRIKHWLGFTMKPKRRRVI